MTIDSALLLRNFRRLVALVCMLVGVAAATSASAAIFTYNAAAFARVHVHAVKGVEVSPAQLKDTPEVSAFQRVAARGASTTLPPRIDATNKADDFANWGGEFVDDAVRAPATRPDFANISAKIERQMQTRGWTPDLIDEAVTSGNKFPAVNKLGGANTPATRYVSPTTGQSVVIDNATGEIIQVGGPGFKYGP